MCLQSINILTKTPSKMNDYDRNKNQATVIIMRHIEEVKTMNFTLNLRAGGAEGFEASSVRS